MWVWWPKSKVVQEANFYSGIVDEIEGFRFRVQYDDGSMDEHHTFKHNWIHDKERFTFSFRFPQKGEETNRATSPVSHTRPNTPAPTNFGAVPSAAASASKPHEISSSSYVSSSSAATSTASHAPSVDLTTPKRYENVDFMWRKKQLSGQIRSVEEHKIIVLIDGETDSVELPRKKQKLYLADIKHNLDWFVHRQVRFEGFQNMHQLSIGFQIKDGRQFKNAIITKQHTTNLYAVRLEKAGGKRLA